MKSPSPTSAHIEQTTDGKLGKGNAVAALRMAEQAVEFHSTDAVGRYLHGIVLEQIGRYKRVLEMYRLFVQVGAHSKIARGVNLLSATLAIPEHQSIQTSVREGCTGLDLSAQKHLYNTVPNYRCEDARQFSHTFDFGHHTQLFRESKLHKMHEMGSRYFGSTVRKIDFSDTLRSDRAPLLMIIAKINDVT